MVLQRITVRIIDRGMRQTLDGRNVFNDMVRVGVGITLLIRRRASRSAGGCLIRYHAVGDRMKTGSSVFKCEAAGFLSILPGCLLRQPCIG